jgi:hypothetical protein
MKFISRLVENRRPVRVGSLAVWLQRRAAVGGLLCPGLHDSEERVTSGAVKDKAIKSNIEFFLFPRPFAGGERCRRSQSGDVYGLRHIHDAAN